jgi:hypothetical protein
MIYTRVFYPDGGNNYENEEGMLKSLLNLPSEDIDEVIKAGIERLKTSN